MVIVDNALAKLEKDGKPIQVGLVGAGYMGSGIALQILKYAQGIRMAAISNRTVGEAETAYRRAGIDAKRVDSLNDLEDAISKGHYVFSDNPFLLCQSQGIDAIVEVTGTIEFGLEVVLKAIKNKKHVILMNAELDSTLGPILKVYADQAGVVITNSDGDQPGVIMNLFRWVKAIGFQPILAGNMKGLHDPYRTPETQKGYAEKFHQKVRHVTSFADGTKISMEMAVVANATGFRVGKRGMYGLRCNHVKEAIDLFPRDQMMEGGLVDYVLGAEPASGVFVLGYNEDPIQRQYMNYYKMGDGPVYCFYTPYHLCHTESPLTVARAVLFHDATIAPLGPPVCDVITAAKRNLESGGVLDGIGGFDSYGMLENSDVCREYNFLPMGLSEGCRLKRNISKDQIITHNDVELPENRLCDKLWAEQAAFFETG
jgi:predicted homoserine dehydrogenase-like protein